MLQIEPTKSSVLPSSWEDIDIRRNKTVLLHEGNLLGPQVRVFKPGRNRRIFQGEKILSAPSFGRGSKTVGPMSLIYGM
jgi:hypothetical protein